MDSCRWLYKNQLKTDTIFFNYLYRTKQTLLHQPILLTIILSVQFTRPLSCQVHSTECGHILFIQLNDHSTQKKKISISKIKRWRQRKKHPENFKRWLHRHRCQIHSKREVQRGKAAELQCIRLYLLMISNFQPWSVFLILPAFPWFSSLVLFSILRGHMGL